MQEHTPQGFFRAVQSGINPTEALLQWGERNRKTGAIQKIRLESPAAKPERRTGPLEIDEMPTTLVQSVRLPPQQLVEEGELRPQLPIDIHGRPYKGVINSDGNTVKLAEKLILEFYAIRGGYPDIIFLTALRYLSVTMRSTHFCIGDTYIPYAYDPNALFPFDVMVRGEKIFSL